MQIFQGEMEPVSVIIPKNEVIVLQPPSPYRNPCPSNPPSDSNEGSLPNAPRTNEEVNLGNIDNMSSQEQPEIKNLEQIQVVHLGPV